MTRTTDVRRFLSTLNRWWWSWLWVPVWLTSLALIVAGYATHSAALRISGEVVLCGSDVWMLSGPVSAFRAYRRLRASRRPKRHEPTQGCHPIHCYSCGIDEPGHGAYIVCGECGHVYPSARSLRRAYRREAIAMERRHAEFWITTPPRRFGWKVTFRASLLTVRASRIYSCALCSHDW